MGLIDRIRKRFEEPLHKRRERDSADRPKAAEKGDSHLKRRVARRPAAKRESGKGPAARKAPGARRAAGSRRGKPKDSRSGRRPASEAGAKAQKVVGAGASLIVEVAKIVREMLVIPAQAWIAVAEVAGRVTLAAWRRLRPILVAAWRLTRRVLAVAERELTPARMTILVALAAIAALVASQWLDYREISVGTADYVGVESVAPPPEIEGSRGRAGDAHSWVMLPLAATALVLVALAALGRWRLARLLVVVGAAVIAISLLVDVPKGLDEGTAAVAYEGAEANLLEGFWAQIVAGGVIIACGVLVPLNLRGRGAPRRRRARRGARGRADGRRGRTGSDPKTASA